MLDKPSVHHASRGIYLQTIIIHINVYFTTHLHIVPMYNGICYCFRHSTFGIVRKFFTIIILLLPFLTGIVSDERYSILQLTNYTTF